MYNKNKEYTKEQFEAFQKAFDYFNGRLFNNELPNVLLNFSRASRAYGFYAPDQWYDDVVEVDEISLNPDYIDGTDRTLLKVYSTLVHEMCHLWEQRVSGKPPRRCYHGKQFAKKMESVGLMTSSTGEKGGKRTGQKMTHYIIEGGVYEEAFEEMPANCKLPLMCFGLTKKSGKTKTARKVEPKMTYQCPICGEKVKGRDGLIIVCGLCQAEMGIL